jgi:hypothetical protein
MIELPYARRDGARRRVSLPCRAVRWGRFEVVSERILDLSTRGALLLCRRIMHPGDEVLLTFRMPWLGPHVLVLGEVARVIEGRRLDDSGYSVGLRFLDLDPADRAELRDRLALLPPTAPARTHPVDYARTVRAIEHRVPPGAAILEG